MTFGLFHSEPSLGFSWSVYINICLTSCSLESLLTSVLAFGLTFNHGRIQDRSYPQFPEEETEA